MSSAIIPRVPRFFSWIREGVAETFEILTSALPIEVSGIPSLTGFDGRSVSLMFLLILCF